MSMAQGDVAMRPMHACTPSDSPSSSRGPPEPTQAEVASLVSHPIVGVEADEYNAHPLVNPESRAIENNSVLGASGSLVCTPNILAEADVVAHVVAATTSDVVAATTSSTSQIRRPVASNRNNVETSSEADLRRTLMDLDPDQITVDPDLHLHSSKGSVLSSITPPPSVPYRGWGPQLQLAVRSTLLVWP